MELLNCIITSKEESLIRLAANVGFYFNIFNQDLGISASVIRNCEKKGLIVKLKPMLIYTQLLEPYILTEKGRDIAKSNYMIYPYKVNTRHVEHDYVLAKIYLSLSVKEQMSWITESELLLTYSNQSVIDGLYKDLEGNRVGVEIITKSYSDGDIKSKESFMSKYCDKSILINTKDDFRGKGLV